MSCRMLIARHSVLPLSMASELQFDGGGPSRGYGLTGPGTFWYVLMCILGCGGAYFVKVSAKKAMWELVTELQTAPGYHVEAISRALYEPAARRTGY